MKGLWLILLVIPLFAQNPCEDKIFVELRKKHFGKEFDYHLEYSRINEIYNSMSGDEHTYFLKKLNECQEYMPRFPKLNFSPRRVIRKCMSGNCVDGEGTFEILYEYWNYYLMSWEGESGHYKYVGSFKDGKFDGSGILTTKTRYNKKYEGEWKEGKRHGFGRQDYSSGNIFAGDWLDGDPVPIESPQRMEFLNKYYENKIPTSSVTPPVLYTNDDVIEGRIDGDYEGWEGETIVKLMNGDLWQQTEYYYHYHSAYNPKVTIIKSGSRYKMKVDGVEKAVGVRKLK